MAWVGVIYYGKCNSYALINCIRHCVRGEFIHIKIKFTKIFSFLLIWEKNLGSCTSWPVAKPHWIHPCIYTARTDPKNFRPVLLLLIVSKIIQKVIHNQTMEYVTENILLKHQFGFLKNHWTDKILIGLILVHWL